eukprot:GEMP01016077.1.p1 GENE.GEMP01016077.1~~GEMP01016077.1.p1  ORF type:complete len:812 (+),score=188.04 GEMP01016077.1:250-2685(+)
MNHFFFDPHSRGYLNTPAVPYTDAALQKDPRDNPSLAKDPYYRSPTHAQIRQINAMYGDFHGQNSCNKQWKLMPNGCIEILDDDDDLYNPFTTPPDYIDNTNDDMYDPFTSQPQKSVVEANSEIHVMPRTINKDHWHSSAVTNFKKPMSPLATRNSQNMENIMANATCLWGTRYHDDALSPKSRASTLKSSNGSPFDLIDFGAISPGGLSRLSHASTFRGSHLERLTRLSQTTRNSESSLNISPSSSKNMHDMTPKVCADPAAQVVAPQMDPFSVITHMSSAKMRDASPAVGTMTDMTTKYVDPEMLRELFGSSTATVEESSPAKTEIASPGLKKLWGVMPKIEDAASTPGSLTETEIFSPRVENAQEATPQVDQKVAVDTCVPAPTSTTCEGERKTTIDPDKVVRAYYNDDARVTHLPPHNTLRILRAYLARLHNKSIPQVSIFTLDGERIPFSKTHLPPPQDIRIQILDTEPVPPYVAMYEHAFAGDEAGLRVLCRKCGLRALKRAIMYYTTKASDVMASPIDGLTLLLRSNGDPNFRSSTFLPPLYWAITFDRLDMTEALLKAKANVRMSIGSGDDEVTILQYASWRGKCDIVQQLLVAGARVNEMVATPLGRASIHFAAMFGNSDLVKLLLDGRARVDLRSGMGDTALLLAITDRHVNTCKLLVEAKASVNRVIGGKTMMHWAAEVEDPAIIELLAANNASTSAVSSDGLAPLHIMAGAGHCNSTEGLVSLLESQANVNQLSGRGDTPLSIAMRNLAVPIVHTLVAFKADVNLRNTAGRNALRFVKGRLSFDTKCAEMLDALKSHGQ